MLKSLIIGALLLHSMMPTQSPQCTVDRIEVGTTCNWAVVEVVQPDGDVWFTDVPFSFGDNDYTPNQHPTFNQVLHDATIDINYTDFGAYYTLYDGQGYWEED